MYALCSIQPNNILIFTAENDFPLSLQSIEIIVNMRIPSAIALKFIGSHFVCGNKPHNFMIFQEEANMEMD